MKGIIDESKNIFPRKRVGTGLGRNAQRSVSRVRCADRELTKACIDFMKCRWYDEVVAEILAVQ